MHAVPVWRAESQPPQKSCFWGPIDNLTANEPYTVLLPCHAACGILARKGPTEEFAGWAWAGSLCENETVSLLPDDRSVSPSPHNDPRFHVFSAACRMPPAPSGLRHSSRWRPTWRTRARGLATVIATALSRATRRASRRGRPRCRRRLYRLGPRPCRGRSAACTSQGRE